mmetsp:Transcript_14403/g.36466  ORF Transcript_14403/g.36466 Transcript_14403/m.36466 type:complete len:239 (+) Transcript_14403:423-1139(+)
MSQPAGAAATLTLDVISDFMCPWCFLGSQQLGRALTALRRTQGPELAIHVRWRPYFLRDPSDARRASKRDMYRRRLGGGDAAVEAMAAKFTAALQPFGERYTVDGQVCSTVPAHRVCEWVRRQRGEAAQWRVANELFRAYHSRGEALDDPDALARAVELAEVGIGANEVRDLLASDDLQTEVLQEARQLRAELGLTLLSGVPHILATVGHQLTFEIPGAQDADYFERIFSTMLAKAKL